MLKIIDILLPGLDNFFRVIHHLFDRIPGVSGRDMSRIGNDGNPVRFLQGNCIDESRDVLLIQCLRFRAIERHPFGRKPPIESFFPLFLRRQFRPFLFHSVPHISLFILSAFAEDRELARGAPSFPVSLVPSIRHVRQIAFFSVRIKNDMPILTLTASQLY